MGVGIIFISTDDEGVRVISALYREDRAAMCVCGKIIVWNLDMTETSVERWILIVVSKLWNSLPVYLFPTSYEFI